ncbi:MAG: hypothetical protein ACOCQD_03125 [archaeon]
MMSIRVSFEEEIVKYLRNHDKIPSQYGTPPRIGTDGDNMELNEITKPFVLVQLLDMKSDIHSFGNHSRDINYILQISCFNDTKTNQKTLPYVIVDLIEEDFKIVYNSNTFLLEIKIKSVTGFDGGRDEQEKKLYKNMTVINGEIDFVKKSGEQIIIQ